MDKDVDEIIIEFPGLKYDPKFQITSKKDPRYNCIAWAYNIDDKWMWPTFDKLDGKFYWPSNIPNNNHPDTLVQLFEKKGYVICESWEHEDQYQKVALFKNPSTNKFTHASREAKSGLWLTKFGIEQDVQHSSPYAIEGKWYGVIYCFMKRYNP